MFRLIKLAAYALLGYALYEFYLGLSGEGAPARQRQSGSSSRQSGGRSFGAAGEGQPVRTQDSNGGSASHSVGRGVVR